MVYNFKSLIHLEYILVYTLRCGFDFLSNDYTIVLFY